MTPLAWDNQRVLVTGAGGFIASHLVEALVERGAAVRAFVHYNSRGDPGVLSLLPAQTLAAVEVIAGDLRDEDAVREAAQSCSLIFHLGALIAIPYSYRHPREVAETNLGGTFNVLMAARETGARLIHTSTSEVYGSALSVPIDESHPLQAQSPYAASKIGADALVRSFYCAYSLPAVTVRPFNTYGPRQSGRSVIPTIIIQALTQPEIRLGNLKATRDFTYVSDTVAGFLAAAQAGGVEGETFNLGSGKEITIGELARTIRMLMWGNQPIVEDAERLRPEKSEVLRLLADNRKAREVLGWAPQVSLAQGLDWTIAWIKDHPERYQADKYQL